MLSALLLAGTLAADLSGTWIGQIERQNNEPLDVAFQFVQKGAVLTGKQYDDYKSPPVVDGKVEGDSVSFAVVLSEQAGNEIRQSRYRYVGKVENGVIRLTRDREMSMNVANGNGAQPPKAPTKQSLQLKRLVPQAGK